MSNYELDYQRSIKDVNLVKEYYEEQGWKVIHAQSGIALPYDLIILKGNKELRVEVKGHTNDKRYNTFFCEAYSDSGKRSCWRQEKDRSHIFVNIDIRNFYEDKIVTGYWKTLYFYKTNSLEKYLNDNKNLIGPSLLGNTRAFGLKIPWSEEPAGLYKKALYISSSKTFISY